MSRIVSVRTILVRQALARPMAGPFGQLAARHNLIVVIETDRGSRGLGEVWANFPPWGCGERKDIVEQCLIPLLIGQTLDDPRRLYNLMMERTRLLALQWGAPGPVHQAVAGVDIALWDAHARDLSVPLRHLLAGRPVPDRVPAYASGIGPDDTVERIEANRAAGHTRFKIRIPFGIEVARRMLREARTACGEAPLMADANQALTESEAETLLPDLAAARLQWLEEPFPVDEVGAYARLAARCPAPLAWGENARGVDGLQACIDSAAGVIQPDITKTLGISEGMVVGQRVLAAGKRLCFHMYGGPLGLIASAQLSAALGADWLETDGNPNPLYERVVSAPPRIEDGCLVLEDAPGLGVTLAADLH
ncbi:MAG: mandelate racemase/muconate lactonizing enzyme family protein [Alphaproteobacteria bacterium]|nr:mandelate racemase/muconate lactonizing enzyme family protein [Alphaproteobacteria bacterium]